jgi:hypothetical protein
MKNEGSGFILKALDLESVLFSRFTGWFFSFFYWYPFFPFFIFLLSTYPFLEEARQYHDGKRVIIRDVCMSVCMYVCMYLSEMRSFATGRGVR